jgi:hypothetical protein
MPIPVPVKLIVLALASPLAATRAVATSAPRTAQNPGDVMLAPMSCERLHRDIEAAPDIVLLDLPNRVPCLDLTPYPSGT